MIRDGGMNNGKALLEGKLFILMLKIILFCAVFKLHILMYFILLVAALNIWREIYHILSIVVHTFLKRKLWSNIACALYLEGTL